MLHGKKVVVVLPAYRAARTLERTYRGKTVRVRLGGDEVLQMDNFGSEATFFDPIPR